MCLWRGSYTYRVGWGGGEGWLRLGMEQMGAGNARQVRPLAVRLASKAGKDLGPHRPYKHHRRRTWFHVYTLCVSFLLVGSGVQGRGVIARSLERRGARGEG